MKFKKIRLPFKLKKRVLATGAQNKNTVCFTQDNLAYLSPVLTDLNNLKDFLAFEKIVKSCLKKRPQIIAYDLHPEYQSTKFAQRLAPGAWRLVPIQHHHAHIAGTMAENGLKNQKVIGVALDGTGLGSDGRIWGGEFLICDYTNFVRKAHLKEIPLLGGERAILEPIRLSFAWLYPLYQGRLLKLIKLDKKEWSVLKQMYLSGFNAPLASSMGRLFDAAAALILGKSKVDFEAQLPIELEKYALRCTCLPGRQAPGDLRGYNFKMSKHKDSYVIDPSPIFKAIIRQLRLRASKEKMAYQFHLTVAKMVSKTCLLLKKESRINKVVLSGGVFQNNVLLKLTLDLLYKQGFTVFKHQQLPCHDASISLGQAVIAAYKD